MAQGDGISAFGLTCGMNEPCTLACGCRSFQEVAGLWTRLPLARGCGCSVSGGE